jgi:hypothetical protein
MIPEPFALAPEVRIAALEAQTEMMAEQLAAMRKVLAVLLPAVLDALDARGAAAMPAPTKLEPQP